MGEGDPEEPIAGVNSWIIGVLFYSLGAMLINLGSNLVKLGHTIGGNEGEGSAVRGGRFRLGGWIFFAIGGVLNFVSFSFGAQSLLSGLAAIQFVTNIFFGALVNGEQLTARLLAGTAIVIVGITLVIWVGPKEELNYEIGDLIALYFKLPMALWIAVNAVAFIGLEILRRQRYQAEILQASNYSQEDAASAYEDIDAPTTHVAPGPAANEVAIKPSNLTGVLFGTTSALLGSQSTLLMKSLSELLKGAILGNDWLNLVNPFTYLLLLGFIISQAFWLYRLNRGLAEYDALFIVPVMQVQWTVLSIVEGMIYFQEYQGLSILEAGFFAGSIFMVFCGVFLLSTGGGKGVGASRYEELGDGNQITGASFVGGVGDWSHEAPASPGIITPYGVRKLDRSTLGKFGVLLSISTAGSWDLEWIQSQGTRINEIYTRGSGSA